MSARRKAAVLVTALALTLGVGACSEEEPEVDPGIEEREVGVDPNTGIGGTDEPLSPDTDLVEPGDADNVTEPEDLDVDPEG